MSFNLLVLLWGACIQSQSIPSLGVLYVNVFEIFQASLLVHQVF